MAVLYGYILVIYENNVINMNKSCWTISLQVTKSALSFVQEHHIIRFSRRPLFPPIHIHDGKKRKEKETNKQRKQRKKK